MKLWKITALYFGSATIPKEMLLGTPGKDFLIKHPYIGYLLQNGEKNILVDTGIHESMIPDGTGWGGYPAEGGNDLVIQALKNEGLSTGDIDSVLYTHFHADHAGGMSLFQNADAYFQKQEYHNLLNQLPAQIAGKDYNSRTIEDLKLIKNKFIIDGDLKLNNGLELYIVPGHTLGSMAIVVPTAKGRYVITGDIPHLRCCLFPKETQMLQMDGTYQELTPPCESMTFLFNKLIYNHFAAYDSFNKLKFLAEEFKSKYYLTGHEPSIIAEKYFG